MTSHPALKPSNTRGVSAPVTEQSATAEPLGTLVIDQRYCGPPDSANGGYTCGRLAEYIPGPATVRLMKPPPLGRRLDVVRLGHQLELRHGEDIIARAWPGGPEIEVPAAPSLQSASARRAHYAGLDESIFPTCFVCGIAREDGDGLRIHAGRDPQAEAVRGDLGGQPSGHVACDWTPHSSFCGEGGTVPAHLIWAALDCPSGWAFLSDGDEIALLGEFSAHIQEALHCGLAYIVAGWEVSRERRKRLTGSAIYALDGRPLAWARATWIVVADR